MERILLGVIGLGARGKGLLNNVLHNFDDVSVTAVCDAYEDRAADAAEKVRGARGTVPAAYTDPQELIADANVQAVLISAAWEAHVPLATAAMRAGKITALEVGGAYSIQDCWQLVRAYEETRTPFMLLENCCFGKRELLATALVRRGVLGEVVYCHGAYGHDLRRQICRGAEDRHYRLRNYLLRSCENYPTDELGPIARLLNVNRGNRMVSLVSVASKSRGLAAYVKDKPEHAVLAGRSFAQGDVVCTLITCADGTLISLKLDTTLPRAYSRELIVSGTKGIFSQPDDVILTDAEGFDHEKGMNAYRDNAKRFHGEYLPRVWREMTPERIAAGHGGMDVLTLDAFFHAIRTGEEMPIDVYDAASWMAVSCLSEDAIATGAPAAIPDFTNGKWLLREPKDVTEL